LFRYLVSGAEIESDAAFSELRFSDGSKPADIRFRLRTRRMSPENPDWFLTSTRPVGRPWAKCGKIDCGYVIRYAGLGDFVVDRSPPTINCGNIEPGVDAATIRHLVLDQALPLVLNLIGRDVLHATAVHTAHGVCAFIGPAGSGKSTLAASLCVSGGRPFCDDTLAIEMGERAMALPGYAGVRLWRDALDAIADEGGGDSSAPVANYTSKRRHFGSNREPVAGAYPLSAIYRVARDDDPNNFLTVPRIEPLGARDAFMEIVSSAFVMDVTDAAALARHFKFVKRLIEMVPVRRLHLPDGFSRLPDVRAAVLSDLNDG